MKRSTIQAIHNRRKTIDQNSQTLAGMLEATIHTGFHDPHKFVYEILQNADDANAKIISFSLGEDYLLVSYDGAPFEECDVERICDVSTHDSAEQASKVYNLNKVGYKGIGFKSVFCVSESVMVISNGYQFLFDKEYWEKEQGFKHPWQIIPIPMDDNELPLIENIRNSQVNILMQKLIVPVAKIKVEIEKICREHESILFLENIQQVRFIHQESHLFLSKENPLQRKACIIQEIVHRDDSLDLSVHRKWCCYSEKAVIVPDSVREQLSGLSTAECPQKIKNADKVKIVFAAEVDIKETQLIPSDKSKLYCALPTAVVSGLYYLVNANFLLNQDRTLILNNAWNVFLLAKIGYLQFKWVAHLASEQGYDTNTLHLVSPKEQVLLEYPMIAANYAKAFNRAIKEVAFIPSINGMLLRVEDCIVDTTHFFDEFHCHIKDVDLLTENRELRLISPRLDKESREILRRVLDSKPENFYTIVHLLGKIELYIKQVKDVQKLLINVVHFFIQLQEWSDSDKAILRKKAIFLTENDTFCSADSGFLPPKESYRKYSSIKATYKLNIIENFYITSAEVQISVENTFHLGPFTLIDFVKKYILPRIVADEEIEDSFLRKNTVDLLGLIYDAFYLKKKAFSNEELDILSRFPVICMEGDKLIRIGDSYIFDEQNKISKKIILSEKYYQSERGDKLPPPDWKNFLQKIGVNLNVELECHEKIAFGVVKKKFKRYSDCFEDYVEDVVSRDVPKLPGQGAKFHPSNPSFKSELEEKPDFAKFLHFVSFVSLPRMLGSTEKAEPYIDLLWLAIDKHFELFFNKNYYSAGRNKTELTEHFLIYCVKRYSLVRVYDRAGEYDRTTKLIYSPAFMDVIKSILPTPDLPEMVSFTEEQAELLGFRRLPTMQECLQLLVRKLEHRSFCAEEIRKIYKLIIEINDKLTALEMEEWNRRNRLPTLSGDLEYASKLSVFNDDDRAPEPRKRWLNDCGLGKIDLSKLADKLHINKFSSEANYDMVIAEISAEDQQLINDVKDNIFLCLPWLVLIQYDGLFSSDAKVFMKMTLDSFYKLTFIRCAKPIGIAGHQKYIYIRDGNLYFCKYPKQKNIDPIRLGELANALVNFLGFYPKVIPTFKDMLRGDRSMQSENSVLARELLELCTEYKKQHPIISPQEPDSIDMIEKFKKLQVEDDKQKEEEDGSTDTKGENSDFGKDKEEDSRRDTKEESSDSDKDIDWVFRDAFTETGNTPRQPEIPLTPISSTGGKKERRSPVITPDLANKQNVSIDSEENKRIGRLGEQRVYDELKMHYVKKYCDQHEGTRIDESDDRDDYNKRGFHISGFDKESKPISIDVIWYNKDVGFSKDLMRDHDIKIIKNGVERYIEVKATKSTESKSITLTGSEWRRMIDARDRYRIFRVYNVDSSNYFFHKIKNPAELIREQQVKVEEVKFSYKTGGQASSYSSESGNSRFFKIVPKSLEVIEPKSEVKKMEK